MISVSDKIGIFRVRIYNLATLKVFICEVGYDLM